NALQHSIERNNISHLLFALSSTSNLHKSRTNSRTYLIQPHPHILVHQLIMTDTLPYDRRGSYSILHNHLRAYEQARLQKLADGKGNEAARARMRIANLN